MSGGVISLFGSAGRAAYSRAAGHDGFVERAYG
jgi:hypothetical protein